MRGSPIEVKNRGDWVTIELNEDNLNTLNNGGVIESSEYIILKKI